MLYTSTSVSNNVIFFLWNKIFCVCMYTYVHSEFLMSCHCLYCVLHCELHYELFLVTIGGSVQIWIVVLKIDLPRPRI